MCRAFIHTGNFSFSLFNTEVAVMGTLPKVKFLFLILFIKWRLIFGETCTDSPPKLVIEKKLSPAWENLTLPQIGQSIYSSSGGGNLFLTCSGKHPVSWNITGIISPGSLVRLRAPKRDLSSGEFKLTLRIFYGTAQSRSDLASSAEIRCQCVGAPEINEKLGIFVKGKENFVFLPPFRRIVWDSKVIPCPTTDPKGNVSLSRQILNHWSSIPVTNVEYDPLKGFILARNSSKEDYFEGTYICKQGNASVTVEAKREGRPSLPTLPYFRDPVEIKTFMDRSLELHCSTPSTPIEFRFTHVSTLSVNYTKNEAFSKSIVLAPLDRDQDLFTGSVACVSMRNSSEFIKEWHYEFVDPPELDVDNYFGEIHCISKLGEGIVQQIVECRDHMDCQYMKRCILNETKCDHLWQVQYLSEKQAQCTKAGGGLEVFNCTNLRITGWSGLVQCKVNGLERTWEFFTALNLLRYSNWETVEDKNELLRIEEVPKLHYANVTSKFTCMAVSFLFADNLAFQIVHKNRTKELLVNGKNANVSIVGKENPLKINLFNIITQVELRLPLEAVRIECLAPFWNTTEIMNTSRDVEVKYLQAPKLYSGSEEEKRTFYAGDSTKLTCKFEGEPQPLYSWKYLKEIEGNDEGSNPVEVFPELKTTAGEDGEVYLEFPSVERKYEGVYICSGVNSVGNSTKKFNVSVTDKPIRPLYLFLGVFLAIFFILIIVAFALLIRRYRQARSLVRMLTDSEIDEFFNGRPDLVSSGQVGAGTVEAIDFRPYNNEYEVALDDIQFDMSDVLGSGAFSFVAKGQILSKNRAVAVKIAKSNVDVTIFKSLLSEVKILLYLDESKNEHVIKLVGVCTSDIRKRNIYIATEICELGSLDKYLRDGRPAFLDLLKGGDMIQADNLRILSHGRLSTFDLVRFSLQIAKGMEYLKDRSVIHGDLACRNVLLTSEKTVKISDFGLSRKLYGSQHYVKKSKSPLPWRWMALESLTTLTFSSESDIWSFGVVLFEIFSLGEVPFPNEEWSEDFARRLEDGMRMGRPKHCPLNIYSQTIQCWENEPSRRPTFSKLVFFFESIWNEFPEFVKKGEEGEIPSNLYTNLYANLQVKRGSK